MKELKWGDTLLKHKVTPEGWIGGIVSSTWESSFGQWEILSFVETGGDPGFLPTTEQTFAPKYPPKGWNGLSELDIALNISELCRFDVYDSDKVAVAVYHDSIIRMRTKCAVDSQAVDITDDYPALIQALQNAQVLSERLKRESKHSLDWRDMEQAPIGKIKDVLL